MENSKMCKINVFNNLINYFPFNVYVIDTNKPPERYKELSDKIEASYLSDTININDLTVVQILILITTLIVGIIMFVLKVSNFVSIPTNRIFYTIIILLLLPILLKTYIRILIKKNDIEKIKSIPIINIFIINALKQNNTSSEILYSLTEIETPYKREFIKAYEILKRNEDEAFNFLIDEFKETNFKETIKVLKDSERYDAENSLKYLSRIQKTVKRQVNNIEKNKLNLSSLYSQIAVVLPFILLSLLVIIPILSTAFKIINTVGTQSIVK